MLTPLRLPRITAQVQITDAQGRPTPLFMRYFNDTLKTIETTINGVVDAQNAADAAREAADTAQQTGETAQQTADGKISQDDADKLYVSRDATPTWMPATGDADRGSFAVYQAPTVTDPPTAAQVQDLANATQTMHRHMKALLDDLIANSTVTG